MPTTAGTGITEAESTHATAPAASVSAAVSLAGTITASGLPATAPFTTTPRARWGTSKIHLTVKHNVDAAYDLYSCI